MRATMMTIAAAGLMLTGCASAPRMPWSKSAAMPTRPACPAMKDEAWRPVVNAAIHKIFDGELQKRFGDTGTHTRLAWSKTDKGDTVITAQRIGPAKFAMPEPGKGGEVEIVFKACTGKPLKTRKLANLEKSPQPLPAESPEN